MPEEIKKQIDSLIRLQETDVAVHEIRKKIAAVPSKIDHLDQALTAFKTSVEKETDNIETLKKRYRELEGDFSVNEAKIRKSMERLGSVNNNKEYQATLKEIDDIKGKNSHIEDEMISVLDRLEEAEHQFGSKNDELSALSRDIEQEKKHIEIERQEDEKKLYDLEQSRNEIIRGIDPKIMKDFDMTRRTVGLITISRVENAVCSGCHMNIPPQKFNEIQRCDSIHYCPNCHRLIYWQHEERPE
ncbi:MAG: C4-type zinc ribbon domain-containing protein [Desulfobacterales bacterium]